MTATSAPAISDRSDLRHVLASGTKLGLLTAAAVVLMLVVYRLAPAGAAREAAASAIVLIAGSAVSLLPGRWAAARTSEGVAGAAAIGLWGTVVFMAVDIVLLRPVRAYPWTWDAIGGGASWWYLPIWWMLGTYLAWMGGLLTAARSARAPAGVTRMVLPLVAGGLVVAAAAAVVGCPVPFAVNAGAGFVGTLTALALVAAARTS